MYGCADRKFNEQSRASIVSDKNLMFDSVLIAKREMKCWSLKGVKWLCAVSLF